MASYVAAAKAIRRERGLRAGRQLGGGYSGYLQRVRDDSGRHAVLKVGVSVPEVQVQALASDRGLLVPTVLSAQEPVNRAPGWLLLSFVGVVEWNFDDRLSAAESPVLGFTGEVWEALSQLHALPMPGDLLDAEDWYARRMVSATTLATRYGVRLPERALNHLLGELRSLPSVVLHGDCSHRNIKRRVGGAGLVMFDISGYAGPAESDLAEWLVSSCRWPLQLPPLLSEALSRTDANEPALLASLTLAIGSRAVAETQTAGGQTAQQWFMMFEQALRSGDPRYTHAFRIDRESVLALRAP